MVGSLIFILAYDAAKITLDGSFLNKPGQLIIKLFRQFNTNNCRRALDKIAGGQCCFKHFLRIFRAVAELIKVLYTLEMVAVTIGLDNAHSVADTVQRAQFRLEPGRSVLILREGHGSPFKAVFAHLLNIAVKNPHIPGA